MKFEIPPSLPASTHGFSDLLAKKANEILIGLTEGEELPFPQYAKDPENFIREILGVQHLTNEQIQILESVRDNRETNVQASHGVGKTFLAACIVLWWVFAVGGRAITTAPTANQVKELLWSEIRKLWQKKKPLLGGECGQMFLRLTEAARAYGFTARDYSPDSFQGIHGERLLAIQDEASGITELIDDGFESCITGGENRGLRIGNPVTPGTPFERSCQKRHIKIPVWTHPNVGWAYQKNEDGIHRLKPEIAAQILTEEGEVKAQSFWPKDLPRDVIPGAVSIMWVEDMRTKKGETSSFWESRLNANFPSDNEFSIIPRSWIEAARQRYEDQLGYWLEHMREQPLRLGLDVGDGGDPHAIAGWKGSVLTKLEERATLGDMMDTMRAVSFAKQHLENEDSYVTVDNIGVGSGALARLKEEGVPSNGMKYSEAATDNKQFVNLKAESFWMLREAFRKEEVVIGRLSDQTFERLVTELTNIYYEELSTGKIKIEDKVKTIKRLGRSPNLADAVVYGYCGKKPRADYHKVAKAFSKLDRKRFR